MKDIANSHDIVRKDAALGWYRGDFGKVYFSEIGIEGRVTVSWAVTL